jgi:hypothetical protein
VPTGRGFFHARTEAAVTEWQDYTAPSGAVTGNDTFLELDTEDTSASSAGTVHQVTGSTLAAAFYKGATASILVLPVSGNSASGNAAAIQAADPGPGVPAIVKLAPVAWNIACGTISHDGSGYYWDATGATITASGTGDLFRLYDDSSYESRTVHGGGWAGEAPFIDGTSTTGASCAFHAGDIFRLRTRIMAQNFTGSGAHGILWDNVWAIAEEMDVDAWVSNCSTLYEWTQTPGSGNTFCFGSYERSTMTLGFSQVNASSPVFKFSAGVYFDGSKATIKGNATGTNSGPITTAMFYATGTSPSGSQDGTGVVSSNFAATEIDCNIELDDNGGTDWTDNPTTFKIDGSCFFGALTGRLDFGAASKAWTPTSAIVEFEGETDGADPGIVSQTTQAKLLQGQLATGTYAAGATLASNGTISTAASWAIVAPTAAVTGVILGAGTWDGQFLTVWNGSAFSVTFAAPGTSNVAAGVNDVIPAGQAVFYQWSADVGQWDRVSQGQFTARLAGTFTATATGTGAQNVTGLAAYLTVGTWKIRGYLPYQGASAAGTTHFGFTFGGTSGTGSIISWKTSLAGTPFTAAPVTSTTITTVSQTSATLTTSPGPFYEVTMTVVVTAAGTLQLQVYNGTSTDDTEVLAGAFLEATQDA